MKILPMLFVSSTISKAVDCDVGCCRVNGVMEVGNSSTIEAGDNLSKRPAFSKDLGILWISATKLDLQSGQRISI